MPFLPGHKKMGGKVKGTVNKRSQDFLTVLERNNFCPASALIEIHNEAKQIYKSYSVIYQAIVEAKSNEQGYPAVVEDKAHTYLKIAADAAKELASYAYPRLKTIEQKNSDHLAGMTPEQKLEAMRQAVKLLEAQVGSNNT